MPRYIINASIVLKNILSNEERDALSKRIEDVLKDVLKEEVVEYVYTVRRCGK
jgi:hypothetical protein